MRRIVFFVKIVIIKSKRKDWLNLKSNFAKGILAGTVLAGIGLYSETVAADEVVSYSVNHSYTVDTETTDTLTSNPATGSYSVNYNETSVNNERLVSLMASAKNIGDTGFIQLDELRKPEPARKEQVHPMGDTKFHISSVFGEVRNILLTNGQYYSDVHNGVDYVGEDGTPILAYRDGEVVYSSGDEGIGEGIIIKHDNGLYSYSWHLQEGSRKVQVGDTVKAGDVIGLQGSTGYVTGSHLHFGLSTSLWSDYVNPEDYL